MDMDRWAGPTRGRRNAMLMQRCCCARTRDTHLVPVLAGEELHNGHERAVPVIIRAERDEVGLGQASRSEILDGIQIGPKELLCNTKTHRRQKRDEDRRGCREAATAAVGSTARMVVAGYRCCCRRCLRSRSHSTACSDVHGTARGESSHHAQDAEEENEASEE
jgi:hypothetical protein